MKILEISNDIFVCILQRPVDEKQWLLRVSRREMTECKSMRIKTKSLLTLSVQYHSVSFAHEIRTATVSFILSSAPHDSKTFNLGHVIWAKWVLLLNDIRTLQMAQMEVIIGYKTENILSRVLFKPEGSLVQNGYRNEAVISYSGK